MKLDNWSVCYKNGKSCLQGNVTGHHAFADGSHIVTSSIVNMKHGKIIMASGSQYELGQVDEYYEAQYPDAKNRIIKTLERV